MRSEVLAAAESRGVSAGLRAGGAVAVLAALKAALDGDGFAYPARLVAAMWYGTPALISSMGADAVGLGTHMAFSAALGAAFCSLGGRRGRRRWLAGLAFGAAIWGLMAFALLPLLNPTMGGRIALRPGTWLSLHLIFGLCLARALRRSTGLASGSAGDSAVAC